VRENNASCRFDMERISDCVFVGEDCLDSRLISLGFVLSVEVAARVCVLFMSEVELVEVATEWDLGM
jgi:hypothetical protein